MPNSRMFTNVALAVTGLLTALVVAGAVVSLRAQADLQSAGRAIVQADTDFARSVADRNRERFLSFIADVTTFNGGSAAELHGRDAVMTGWSDFFDPKGPTLSWTPTKGEVIGAGDLGYTTGRSLLRMTAPDGKVGERRGEYLTVWRRQADGNWKVVFDTGSTLPPAR